jgi:hypothetical protein
LNNNSGYDKIKVANGIQQRSYISFCLVYVCFGSFVKCSRVSYNIWIGHKLFQLTKVLYKILQERSLDIGRALKSVNLIQSSLDCRANVEQFNRVEGPVGQ